MSEKTIGENVKTWLEIAALAGTLILGITLLIRPNNIVTWCKSAGFTKCSVMGVEYETKLLVAEQAAGETRSQTAVVSEKFQSLSKAVKEATVGSPPKIQQELQARMSAVSTAVGQMENLVEKNLTVIGNVVDDVVKADFTKDGAWAVVFGGSPSLDAANETIDKAKRAGIRNTRVFHKTSDGKSSYRSTVLFESRENARRGFDAVNALTASKDAYIVRVENWCKELHDSADEKYGALSECK